MLKDKFIPHQQCATVYMKPESTFLPESFFETSTCKDSDKATYIENFEKPMDSTTMRIVVHYHPHKDVIPLMNNISESQGIY